MSIYVYITRRRNPIEEGPKIDEAEWLAAIAEDHSFRQPDSAELGHGRRPARSVYGVWKGHPLGYDAWFTWTNGQIDVKNPDEPLIAKAIEIAQKLKAEVVS